MRIPDPMGVRLGALYAARLTALPMGLVHRLLLGSAVGPGFRAGSGSSVVARSVRIDRDVTIGRRVDIAAEEVVLGEGCKIADDVVIRCRRLVMEPGSRIDERTVVRGYTSPNSGLTLGEEAWIYSDCHLNTDEAITIGARTAAGSHCLIFTHSHYLPQTHGYPVKLAPVSIGSDTWLPWHAFILPGTRIGNGATVGAFSLVGGEVPDECLAVGVPARIVKDAASYRRRYDEAALISLGRTICATVAQFATESFRPNALFFPAPRSLDASEQGVFQIRDGIDSCSLVYEPDADPERATQLQRSGSPCLFVDARPGRYRESAHALNLTDVRARLVGPLTPLGEELVGRFSSFGIHFPRRDRLGR